MCLRQRQYIIKNILPCRKIIIEKYNILLCNISLCMTDLIMYLREEIYDSAENDRDNAVYHYYICIIHTFCTVHSV